MDKKNEKIFDLDEVDENEISAIEVPELERIDSENEDSRGSSDAIELTEEDLIKTAGHISIKDDKKILTIPVNIEIPEGERELEVILKLKITSKKED